MKRLTFIIATLILLVAGACRKDEPAVPTEKDGEQVSFKKTNGQLEGDHYILYFEAQERYLTDSLKPKGTVATVKAAYEFQKTENGWLGQTTRSTNQRNRSPRLTTAKSLSLLE